MKEAKKERITERERERFQFTKKQRTKQHKPTTKNSMDTNKMEETKPKK